MGLDPDPPTPAYICDYVICVQSQTWRTWDIVPGWGGSGVHCVIDSLEGTDKEDMGKTLL